MNLSRTFYVVGELVIPTSICNGYMSPEYVVDGLFSIKSDVYSFGAMVPEIVSGKKNRGLYHPDHQLNLLGHAWTEGS
ncbi:unnamed protein product [Prunus armeniaca]